MRALALATFSIPFLACRPDPGMENPPAVRGATFDEESLLVYGAVAPPMDERESALARAELDRLLPGQGPLAARYASFQTRFLVPPEVLDEAFTRALAECRLRTLERLDLPEDESVRIEYVSGAPWPMFTRYLGDYRSVVQVNRDFPLAVANVLEIASHEAYPGHHVVNVLRERSFGRERSLEPAAGSEAILDEGLASYGVELAFPGEERLRFEREVLFPLAGLDRSEADRYHRVEREVRRLAPLRIEAARAYLDGKRDRVQSVLFLESEALVPAPWAFLRFVDRYRAYVIAYTLGPERVRRRIGKSTDPWREYAALATEANDET